MSEVALNGSAIRSSETLGKLTDALAQAQAEFKEIKKEKIADAGTYKYKYADIADVLASVRPSLAKFGIAFVQLTTVESGTIFIRTRLMHKSGEWIESEYPVASYANQNHQKIGAALTYARRYAGCAMLGVAAEEDVDAGDNAATAGVKPDRARQQTRREPPTVVTQESNKPLPPVAGAKKAEGAFYFTDKYGQPEMEPLDESAFVKAMTRELLDCPIYQALDPLMKHNADMIERVSKDSKVTIGAALDQATKRLRREMGAANA